MLGSSLTLLQTRKGQALQAPSVPLSRWGGEGEPPGLAAPSSPLPTPWALPLGPATSHHPTTATAPWLKVPCPAWGESRLQDLAE